MTKKKTKRKPCKRHLWQFECGVSGSQVSWDVYVCQRCYEAKSKVKWHE